MSYYVTADGTPFGKGGDWCPECGADWKAPHHADCSDFHKCQYPPGCSEAAMPSRYLCREHYDAVYALFGPKGS